MTCESSTELANHKSIGTVDGSREEGGGREGSSMEE